MLLRIRKKAFQNSEKNHSKTLASLQKVYNYKCLPEITKKSAVALRSIVDTVSAIYDSLLLIGDDKKITNAILIYLVGSSQLPNGNNSLISKNSHCSQIIKPP